MSSIWFQVQQNEIICSVFGSVEVKSRVQNRLIGIGIVFCVFFLPFMSLILASPFLPQTSALLISLNFAVLYNYFFSPLPK